MSLRELTGLPTIFRDFGSGSCKLRVPLPRCPDLESLGTQAGVIRQNFTVDAGICDFLQEQASQLRVGGRTLSNILKLAGGKAVVVASMHRAALFGGLISDLGKALTTVKLAGELERKGVRSVPILCLAGSCQNELEVQTLGFVGSRGDLLEFTFNLMQESTPNGQGSLLIPTEASRFLDRLDVYLGPGVFDPAVYQTLKQTHAPGTRLARAWGVLMSALLEEWGVIVLDLDLLRSRPAASGTEIEREGLAQLTGRHPLGAEPLDCLRALHRLSSALPVAAVVAGPSEPGGWTAAAFPAHAADFPIPPIWPQVSLTLVDRRSWRMLGKHQIPFDDVFDGAEALLQEVLPGAVIRQATKRLDEMKRELEGRSSALRHLLGLERASRVKLERALRRIEYQISKLEERCTLHHQRRQEILRRQFERIYNRLSPNGRPQESQIAALQILHDYSRAALPSLCDKMDVSDFKHQFIIMD